MKTNKLLSPGRELDALDILDRQLGLPIVKNNPAAPQTLSAMPGPAVGYVDLLDEVTTENLVKDKGKFNKSPLRPSSAGACTRSLAYQVTEHQGKAKYDGEVNTPAVSRLLGLGHNVEYHVIKQFEQLREFFEIRYKQQVLSFEYLESKHDPKYSQWIEGSLDLVFWSDKFKCVADVKSKKDKFNAAFKTDWDNSTYKLKSMKSVKTVSEQAFWVEDLEAFLAELNDTFFAANFKQLNLYANSQFLIERGINHGLIIQYNKNDSRMREIRFKPSRALYEKTIQKYQIALDAGSQGKPQLAPRDHALGSIACAFCKYKGDCWDGADAKQEFFNTFSERQPVVGTKSLGVLGAELDKEFATFEQYSATEVPKKHLESEIVRKLLEAKVNKVRLGNGNIYEVKRLKDSIVLRRGKY